MWMHPWVIAAVLAIVSTMHVGSQEPPKQSARQIQCERKAMGEWYRAGGYAGKVVWMPREQMVGEEPKDAIHVRDDGETDAEKENWNQLLLSGWHTQDEWMAAHDGHPRDPREGFAICLNMEDS